MDIANNIYGRNTSVSTYELDDEDAATMSGLIGRPRLKDLGWNYYSERNRSDFEHLNLFDIPIEEASGCLMLPLTNFSTQPRHDKRYKGFLASPPKPDNTTLIRPHISAKSKAAKSAFITEQTNWNDMLEIADLK